MEASTSCPLTCAACERGLPREGMPLRTSYEAEKQVKELNRRRLEMGPRLGH